MNNLKTKRKTEWWSRYRYTDTQKEKEREKGRDEETVAIWKFALTISFSFHFFLRWTLRPISNGVWNFLTWAVFRIPIEMYNKEIMYIVQLHVRSNIIYFYVEITSLYYTYIQVVYKQKLRVKNEIHYWVGRSSL